LQGLKGDQRIDEWLDLRDLAVGGDFVRSFPQLERFAKNPG
jgi:hypothetical protein